jgi:hypothetical protein
MAKHLGLSHTTVGRVWRAFDLQPHRSETFTTRARPAADREEVRDIVGL